MSMSLLDCCTPCCPTTQTVNVPGVEGVGGADGADGTDGENSYTLTTSTFAVPEVGANVTVAVVSSLWMVVGQKVVVEGVATFEVISKPGATSAVLKFMGYADDVAVGTTISAGSAVGTSGVQPDITGLADAGANTDITSLGGLTTPLSVAQGGTGAGNASAAAKNLTIRERCIALIGADFNSTGDQAISGFPASYIIRRITATNASLNLTTAQGGLYTGAGKTGVTIVAAGQVYTALTAAGKFVDLTLAAGVTGDRMTATTIYFALTTAQGAAATGDVLVEFEDLT
jgi:hypothetical protein